MSEPRTVESSELRQGDQVLVASTRPQLADYELLIVAISADGSVTWQDDEGMSDTLSPEQWLETFGHRVLGVGRKPATKPTESREQPGESGDGDEIGVAGETSTEQADEPEPVEPGDAEHGPMPQDTSIRDAQNTEGDGSEPEAEERVLSSGQDHVLTELEPPGKERWEPERLFEIEPEVAGENLDRSSRLVRILGSQVQPRERSLRGDPAVCFFTSYAVEQIAQVGEL